MVRPNRQQNVKCRSRVHFTRQPEPPAMSLGQAPRNGEAKASSAFSMPQSRFGLAEDFEDGFLMLMCNPRPGIPHRKKQRVILLMRADGDIPRFSEFAGIRD